MMKRQLWAQLLFALCGLLANYLVVTSKFDFLEIRKEVYVAVLIFIAIGLMKFKFVRCFFSLHLATLISNTPRKILHAYIILALLNGPISNIVENLLESVRVMHCHAKLKETVIKSKYNLLVKPFQQAMLRILESNDEIEEIKKSIKQAYGPVNVEVTGNTNGYRNGFADYEKKMQLKCKDIFKKGYQKCQQSFEDSRKACMKELPPLIGSLFCEPLNLPAMCDLSAYISESLVCESAKQLDSNVTENFVKLNDINRQIIKSLDFTFQKNTSNFKTNVTGVEIEEEKWEKLKQIKHSITSWIKRFRRIFPVLFYLVSLWQTKKYVNCYSTLPKFDNTYITPYFHSLDELLEQKILPLDDFEKKKYGIKFPMKSMIWMIIRTLVYIVWIAVIIVISNYFTFLLTTVRKHGELKFQQLGKHKIKLVVKGSGLISKLIRTMFKNLDESSTLNQLFSNTDCLPNPVTLPLDELLMIVGLLLALIIFNVLQPFLARFRQKICSYFFKEMEEKRIFWLRDHIKFDRRNRFHHKTD